MPEPEPHVTPAMFETELSRDMGLPTALAIGVGTMIAAGIFTLSGLAVRNVGSAAVVAFLIAALVAVFTALTYCEFAAAYPETGEGYLYARRTFRPVLPTAGGPHAQRAEHHAASITHAEHGTLTICSVVAPDAPADRVEASQQSVNQAVKRIGELDGVSARLIRDESVIDGIIAAAKEYDAVVVGAAGDPFSKQLLFGNIPEKVARFCDRAAIMVRRHPNVKPRRPSWQPPSILPGVVRASDEAPGQIQIDGRTSSSTSTSASASEPVAGDE